jgi:hypothetical protein
VQFTADAELMAKLQRAQDLLSHRLPDGDLATLLGEALDLLCDKVEKERFGARRKAKVGLVEPQSDKPLSRHIPRPVRRQVYERDEGQCVFVSGSGRRCGERRFLEVHHRAPWARGGCHTVENLELRCRAHNQHAARQDYGPDLFENGKRSR